MMRTWCQVVCQSIFRERERERERKKEKEKEKEKERERERERTGVSARTLSASGLKSRV